MNVIITICDDYRTTVYLCLKKLECGVSNTGHLTTHNYGLFVNIG